MIAALWFLNGVLVGAAVMGCVMAWSDAPRPAPRWSGDPWPVVASPRRPLRRVRITPPHAAWVSVTKQEPVGDLGASRRAIRGATGKATQPETAEVRMTTSATPRPAVRQQSWIVLGPFVIGGSEATDFPAEADDVA